MHCVHKETNDNNMKLIANFNSQLNFTKTLYAYASFFYFSNSTTALYPYSAMVTLANICIRRIWVSGSMHTEVTQF